MKYPGAAEEFFAKDLRAWRAWLKKHHGSKKEIWLVVMKKASGQAGLSSAEAVEEALCYGWIDGRIRRLDQDRYAMRFTPRRTDSVWSETNKERVRRMIEAGRMTKAGRALVEIAKENGQWDRRNRLRTEETIPADLESALSKGDAALENFKNFAPSYRKLYIAWVLDAKRDETRRKRIRIVVERCAQGKKPGINM